MAVQSSAPASRWRYHAWMTRAMNGERFTFREHCLYASVVLVFGLLVGGVSLLALERPSVATFVLMAFVYAFTWWVMSRTPE